MKTIKRAIIATGILAMTGLTTGWAITVDLVPVEDVGNANDSTGYGGVSTSYTIGKYETSVSDYTAFLNAVAATDTYNLYNPSMASDARIAGITRVNDSGSYVYSVVGSGNQPISYVSWFDAARYINWLHNGQPSGAQTASTTEGGAYTLSGATFGVGFTKNVGALYWIPSQNEWYKAAYYQPTASGGPSDGYWLYPTQSDSIPNSRNGSTTDANSGNFFRDVAPADGVNDGYAVSGTRSFPSGYSLTDKGAFTLADSYYGTFDQGGSLFEWNDTFFGSSMIVRGGSWTGDEGTLQATSLYGNNPGEENYRTGFRVASVPEPTAAILIILGMSVLLVRRRALFTL